MEDLYHFAGDFWLLRKVAGYVDDSLGLNYDVYNIQFNSICSTWHEDHHNQRQNQTTFD